MKIEKLRCDNCGKEYAIDSKELEIRIIGSDEQRSSSQLIVDGTTLSVKNRSFDFCNLACFQAYVEKQTQEPTIP